MRSCRNSLQFRQVYHHLMLSWKRTPEQEPWIRNLNISSWIRSRNLKPALNFHITRAASFLASLENITAEILNLMTRTWIAFRRHQGHPFASRWCNWSLLAECHSWQMLVSFLFKNILGNCTNMSRKSLPVLHSFSYATVFPYYPVQFFLPVI